ncbi:MAG: L-fuculose phosphate aldolase [Candidatus Heimdallarchaeota archaeon LC_3]|nr:MAG: L-fuculose phosphate aldolase [Candidatus Heimdallarchaeota archaeon LC_3]
MDENIKDQMCQIMKDLYEEKILTDIGGNLSFREADNNFLWITPTEKQKNLVEPEDLIKMDFNGNILLDKNHKGPSVEAPMHSAIMQEDSHFKSIIHSHPPYATAYSLIANPPKLPRLTAELSILIPEIVIVPYTKSGTKELGKLVATALQICGIAILENHGVVAVAENFQRAAQKTRALEEYFRLYLITKRFGSKIRPFQD